MRLNDQRASLDALVRELEGTAPDRAKTTADRLETARRAKAVRPFFLVTPLDRRKATVAANEEIELQTDKSGFAFVGESFGTDQQQASVLFNFARYRGSERRTWFTRPLRASYFAGDTGADANRVAPQDLFYPPEAMRLDKDEQLSILVNGDPNTLSSDLTNTYLTVAGRRVYQRGSPEAQLDGSEQADILGQINNSRPEWRLSRCHIDYASSALSTNIEFDRLDEWCILRGFATDLRWSLVKVADSNAHIWTNNGDGIPSLALASYPFYTDGTTYENFKLWPYGYLVAPNRPLRLSCTQRAAAGGFPHNVAENASGDFVAIFETV